MNQAQMQTDVCQSQAIERIPFDTKSALSKAHIAATEIAWEAAINNQWPDVCRLHAILMRPSDLQLPEIGQWRTVSAIIKCTGAVQENRHLPSANALSELMKEWESLCKYYLAKSDQFAIDREVVVDHLYYHFLCIHPFADGNGRVGRLVRSVIRVLLGLSWGTITADRHSLHILKIIRYEDDFFRPKYLHVY